MPQKASVPPPARPFLPLGWYSIFNTPGGVGGQPGALLRVKAGDPLDEADGADGDEILLIGALGIVLFEQVKQKEEFSRSKTTP